MAQFNEVPAGANILMGIVNLRGSSVPVVTCADREAVDGICTKHVVVASLKGEGDRDDCGSGLQPDEVIGTCSTSERCWWMQAQARCACCGMLRPEDRMALDVVSLFWIF